MQRSGLDHGVPHARWNEVTAALLDVFGLPFHRTVDRERSRNSFDGRHGQPRELSTDSPRDTGPWSAARGVSRLAADRRVPDVRALAAVEPARSHLGRCDVRAGDPPGTATLCDGGKSLTVIRVKLLTAGDRPRGPVPPWSLARPVWGGRGVCAGDLRSAATLCLSLIRAKRCGSLTQFHRDHQGARAHLLATCWRSAGAGKGLRRRRAQRVCPRPHRRLWHPVREHSPQRGGDVSCAHRASVGTGEEPPACPAWVPGHR